jgi:hypothetical protein
LSILLIEDSSGLPVNILNDAFWGFPFCCHGWILPGHIQIGLKQREIGFGTKCVESEQVQTKKLC